MGCRPLTSSHPAAATHSLGGGVWSLRDVNEDASARTGIDVVVSACDPV